MIAILLLGGNLGNRDANLRFALFHLKKNVGEVLQMSKIYESGAWGKVADKPFLNQVVEMKTSLSPQDLLEAILFIEKMAGRKRTLKYLQAAKSPLFHRPAKLEFLFPTMVIM